MRASFATLLRLAAFFSHNEATLKLHLKGNMSEDFETGNVCIHIYLAFVCLFVCFSKLATISVMLALSNYTQAQYPHAVDWLVVIDTDLPSCLHGWLWP